uniref:Pentraxin (PTX) domain-containing protein n=1 Tax=Haplochromis burtoni TaxID=8153 RepID=A0A3Q2W597_HAPBU
MSFNSTGRINALVVTIDYSWFLSDVPIKTLVFSTATSTSYMMPQKPLNLTAFTLCMRVATELSGQRAIILFAYRTGSYDELNVWCELDGRLQAFTALIMFSIRKWIGFNRIHYQFLAESEQSTLKQTLCNILFVLLPREICDVNMWDVVLADSVIQGMFAGEREARGNVFDWESTELRINGDVEVAIHELYTPEADV